MDLILLLFYTMWINNKCFWPFLFPTFHFFWELNQSTLKPLECLIYGYFLKGRCIMKSGHLFYISLQRNAALSTLVARKSVCYIESEHVPTSTLCSFITLNPALLRENRFGRLHVQAWLFITIQGYLPHQWYFLSSWSLKQCVLCSHRFLKNDKLK